MALLNRRDILKLGVGAICGITLPGCSFFKTDFIRTRAREIMETQGNLFDRYMAETGVVSEPYPAREETPYWTLSEDGLYTLYYKVAYGDIADLEKIISNQITGANINSQPDINQLIITIKNESQRSQLEELLYNSDRLPRQVSIRLEVSVELGNITQDYSSELNLLYKSQGQETGTISADATIPGAEPRVMARGSMINRWGLELDSTRFALKAFLDVLESHGYVNLLYQTDMLLANNKQGKLGEDEKLLIPAFILSGRETVQTYNLADVISSVEITPIIHDGLVELSFQAIIGGSKRPEIRQRIMVPVKDTVQIDGAYLKIGEPYILAGRTKNFEIGIVRKDPLWPWPAGQDYENRVTRIWYTITPNKVIIYDPLTLVRPEYRVIKLNSKGTPNAMLFDPSLVPDYKMPKPLIRPAA